MNVVAVAVWRNPFRVVEIRTVNPRVASVRAGLANTRQPWALRRNPFGILGLRRLMVIVRVRSRRLPMTEPIIDLQSDHYFMGEALRQAARAYEADEVPIGAVLVREGRIIARAFNQVELLKDATAHAEMLAVTQAEAAVGDWRLTDCDLFVTKEPCPMCAGAIVHVRLLRVIFGALDPKAGAAGTAMNLLQFPSFNHRCDITRGVREEECRLLL